MTLPRKDPSNGPQKRIHWGYVRTTHNASWIAYLWGEVHWYQCHGAGRSKACVASLTEGELTCPHCQAGLIPTWNGYTPLIRESDGKPSCVIIHESARDLIAGIRWRERVTVTRGAERCDGVAVCRALKQQQWHTTLTALAHPADLTETLLAFWQIPELTEWYRRTHGATSTPSTKGTTIGPLKPLVLPDGSELELSHEEVNRRFVESVRRAGRTPVLPPTVAESLPNLNGKAKRK